jgi:hypothetical protein
MDRWSPWPYPNMGAEPHSVLSGPFLAEASRIHMQGSAILAGWCKLESGRAAFEAQLSSNQNLCDSQPLEKGAIPE